jgi:membrane peptidoglycan carboxypeptidase
MDDNANNKNRKFLEMYGTGGQKKIHGASFPAEIWHDYMEDALKGKRPEKFPTPEPIGVVVNDIPTPTPTPSLPEPEPEEEETPTPSPTPSEPTTSPSPTPSNTCEPFDFECNNNGGEDNGGADNGGADGGASASPTESDPPGNNGGNDNGGIFG